MGQVVSLTKAKRLRQRLRAQGKTAVFTNGVFDLLHVGHVRCLNTARELGHALFVGLNNDASARHLKGPDRPWVPEVERAEALCALRAVDYVILFGEATAEHVVAALQPDVYVKGGDYAAGAEERSKALPEALVVEGYGGRVVILPYTRGHSTTELIARIRQSGKGS
jgi:D-beta-D-heptose 7-phosphate kinase/D-beta-D-heptose 1-phosphate adenosyltransferase